ncbi:MAG TPA: DUF3376 domain-containing protein, partial [Symbiobacteriaceae bacterium]|nr:DUF3376 domain-containing protein [Symbiobacteriaceae bacterium]
RLTGRKGVIGYAENDLAAADPAADKAKRERLIRLCRATAAFPGAFAPEDVPDAYAGEHSSVPDNRSSIWMSDGGILNNHPFAPVLDTVFRRPSEGAVERILFYVEPALADAVLPDDVARSRKPDAFTVLRRSMEMQLYQGIDRHMEELQEHNDQVEQLRRATAGFSPAKAAGNTADYRHSHPYHLYITFRSTRVIAELCRRLEWNLRRAGHPAEEIPHTVKVFRKRLTALKPRTVLARYDAEFLQRRLYYLIEKTRGAETAAEHAALWETLKRLQYADYRTWLEADLKTLRDPDQLLHRLAHRVRRQRRLTQDCVREHLSPVLHEEYYHYEAVDMLLLPLATGTRLGEREPIAWVRLSPYDADSIFEPDPRDGAKVSREARLSFGSRKVAGDALMNFSGFLSWRWRANDFMWGRLDAADILISSLIKQAADSGRYTPDELRRIRRVAADVRLSCFQEILHEGLHPYGRQELVQFIAEKDAFMDRLTNWAVLMQQAVTTGKPSPETVMQQLNRDLPTLTAMAGDDPELRQALSPFQEVAGAFQSGGGSLLGTVISSLQLPALRTAGRPKTYNEGMVRRMSWADMHTFLLRRYATGQEGVMDLHPAVPATVGIDLADNTRRVLERIIQSASGPVQPVITKFVQAAGYPIAWVRAVVRPLIRRPVPREDDRRPSAGGWAKWLSVPAFLIVTWLADRVGGASAAFLTGVGLALLILVWTGVTARRPAADQSTSSLLTRLPLPPLSWLGFGILLQLVANPGWLAWKLPGLSITFDEVLDVGGALLILGYTVSLFTRLALPAGGRRWAAWLRGGLALVLSLVTVPLVSLVAMHYGISQSDSLPEPTAVTVDAQTVLLPDDTPVGPPEGIAPAGDGYLVSTVNGYVMEHLGPGQWEQKGRKLDSAAGLIADSQWGYLLAGREQGAGGLYRWDAGTGDWALLVEIPGYPNGLAAYGDRIFVSTLYPGPRVWQITRTADGVQKPESLEGQWLGDYWAGPNGLAIRDTGRAVYLLVAESLSGRILQVPLNRETGAARGKAHFLELARVPWFPDGILTLEDGRVAVSTNGGHIYLVDPDQQAVQHALALPSPDLAAANMVQSGRQLLFAGVGQTNLIPVSGTFLPGRQVGSLTVPKKPGD